MDVFLRAEGRCDRYDAGDLWTYSGWATVASLSQRANSGIFVECRIGRHCHRGHILYTPRSMKRRPTCISRPSLPRHG